MTKLSASFSDVGRHDERRLMKKTPALPRAGSHHRDGGIRSKVGKPSAIM